MKTYFMFWKRLLKRVFILSFPILAFSLLPISVYGKTKIDQIRIDPIQTLGLKTSSTTSFDPFEFVNAPAAWLSYQSQKEIIVAVIDTGVDSYHEDLADVIWTNSLEIPDNGIDDDGNGYIDDVNGWNFYDDSSTICSYNKQGTYNLNNNDNHGTHVAGIIGAIADNGIGINGIASNVQVKIMPLKVTGGKNGTGKTSSLIKAIQYASDMGASVCNISLNSSTYNEELYLTMLQSPMLFVCSAGNQNSGGLNIDETKTYPASFSLPNVISVSALDTTGQLASYSNYGIKSVEISAPGSSIYSTLVGNTYGRFSGTSMATPFVSGTAAMLMTLDQNYYASEIKQLLMDSSTPIESLKGKVRSGGALNVNNALSLAETSIHEKDITAPRLKLSISTRTVSITASDKESGIKTLTYLRGKKGKSAFKKGNGGTKVTSLTMNLEKGTYTFYCADWEGNETLKTISIS